MIPGSRLRTVHVDTERTWGGGQRQVAWLAAGLAARGHPTWVVARGRSRFGDLLAGTGVTVVPLDPIVEWSVPAAARLHRLAARTRADLLVAHTAHAAALVALATVLGGPPYVVTRRVALPLRAGALSRWKYRQAAGVIAVSERVREALVGDGVPPRHLSVVHSGIDLGRPAAPAAPAVLRGLGVDPTRPVAVMVSALVPPHKDPGTFVLAMAIARRTRPDLQALLVGDGPLLPAIRALVRKSSLDGILCLAGHRDDAEALLAAGTVAVLTSRDEGLGTTLLDAMLWGVPVVATRAGGVVEVVRDGMDGLLADVGDASGVAAGLLRVLNDDGLRSRLVASARQRVESFTTDAMVDGSIVAYCRALYSARC